MDVTEQLPDILVAAFKTKERIVTEVYSLLADFDVHLHSHMLKAADESLSNVLQIVVTHDQIYLAIQTVEYLCPFCRTTQAEIAQVENRIIFTYHAVPIRYHHLVHLLYVLERTIAKPDDVRMIEVRIRCEERMFCIKLEIHFLLCFILSMPHLEHGESLLIN